MSGGNGGAGLGLEFADLGAAIDRFCVERDRSRSRPAPGGLEAELVGLRQLIEVLELEFSRDAAAFAATDEYDSAGSVSAIDHIRHRCKMGRTAAADRVSVGGHLDQLEASADAMVEGRIGYAHLVLLARTGDYIASIGGAFDERDLLHIAAASSVGRFRYECEKARHAADAERYADDEAERVQQRTLTISTPGDNGLVYLRGVVDSAGGASIRTALEALARKSGADDDRDHPRRLMDALVELAGHSLDTGAVPQRGNVRTHLQVTTTLDTLLGLAGAPAADLELSLPISAKTVERLACDCTVARVLLGADSMVIDVGRARRVVSAPLRRALQAEQPHCQWPGCERPASWTEAHHLTHWIHGGGTDKENLVLLCNRHHWMVHEGRWQILRTDAGLTTIPPITPWTIWGQARAPARMVVA